MHAPAAPRQRAHVFIHREARHFAIGREAAAGAKREEALLRPAENGAHVDERKQRQPIQAKPRGEQE